MNYFAHICDIKNIRNIYTKCILYTHIYVCNRSVDDRYLV